jgi:hypothetical protein
MPATMLAPIRATIETTLGATQISWGARKLWLPNQVRKNVPVGTPTPTAAQ